jgi:ElaB/YqjD/DUF883 family membrane-anchored ribosome-binding protein
MPRSNGQKANVDQLLNDIKAVVHDGQELLKVGATQLKKQARVRASTTDRLVRSNPYRLLALAAGLGFVVGFLAACRCNSQSEAETPGCE